MSYRIGSVLIFGLAMIAAQAAQGQTFLQRLERALGSEPAAPVAEPPMAERGQPGSLGLVADDTERGEIIIVEVDPGGAADRAGLRKGDRLLAMEDRPLRSLDGMGLMLEPYRASDTIRLKYLREGQEQTAQLTLLAPPRQAPAPDRPALELLERQLEEVAPPPRAEPPLRLGNEGRRTLEEPPPPGLPPEAAEPSGNGPFEGRRPAGRLLNQLLQGVQQGNQPPPPPDARQLEQHVEALEAYIDRLERRIVELEARLEQAER